MLNEILSRLLLHTWETVFTCFGFCLRADSSFLLLLSGEMFEGQRLEACTAVWPCLGVLPMGFSWSLFLAHCCKEEKACLAPSLRRVIGKAITQLIL